MKPAMVGASLLVLMSWGLPGQPGSGSPSFEVVSVKRNKSGAQVGKTQTLPGGRFSALNTTVRQVIVRAYGVQDVQIAGGPGWVNSDRFDIDAKGPGGVSEQQLTVMLRKLLAQRFKLAAHIETRDLPVYALVLLHNGEAKPDGKLGPQLRPSKVDCDVVAAEAFARRGGAPPPRAPGETPPCSIGFGGVARMTITARAKPLSQLLPIFSQVTGRTVLDRTGLTGSFDVDLTWTPDQSAPEPSPGVTPNVSKGPSIFTAVQEQLGLKLEPQKAPVPALVIDRIEPPAEN